MSVLLALVLPMLAGSGETDLYRRAVTAALARASAEVAATVNFEVDHSRWEDPWVVTTEHYEVRTIESYAQARKIASDTEYMRGEFVKLLGTGSGATAGRRAKIWILPGIDAYNAFNASANEHSSMYGSIYAGDHAEQPVVTYRNSNPTWLDMWVTHGALHQFVAQEFGSPPAVWIDEGLASYFAVSWDLTWGAHELDRLEKTRTFVPLERMVREPIQAYVGNADPRFVELGMLFQFLLHSWESTRNGPNGEPGSFQEFLRAAVRSQDVSQSEFAQTFQEASDQMEEDLRSFDFTK